jgi:hypothetical protein
MHPAVVDGAEASTTGAKMGMIIGAIIELCGTWFLGNYSEKTAHDLKRLKNNILI